MNRVIKMCEDRGDFSPLDDGFIYYFPSHSGAMSAHELRTIADELDRRNTKWQRELDLYFDDDNEPLMVSG